ncbi:MAG: nucleotidyltransferase family protein [Candidatus Omnitrophica bacterium]|nr:nucleotidyltransferase family protein [Candidatus Omnitrophota bacterium]
MLDIDSLGSLNAEQKLILYTARWVVEGRCFDDVDLKDIDWEFFIRIASSYEILPFFYLLSKEESISVPGNYFKKLENIYSGRVLYSSYLWDQFLILARHFNNKNVDFFPLKGMALIAEYLYCGRIFARPTGDIDIFIKKRDLGVVEDIMKNLGYEYLLHGFKRNYWLNSYHLCFYKQEAYKFPVTVEVHWLFDYPIRENVLEYAWKRSVKKNIENVEICLLSPEDSLLSIVIHRRRNLANINSMKNICDVAVILSKYELDWDYIIKEAKKSKIYLILVFTLVQIKSLLGKDHHLSYGIKEFSFLRRLLLELFIFQRFFKSHIDLSKNSNRSTRGDLKMNFLLYDNILDLVKYAFKIPKEQFMQLYNLNFYTLLVGFFYQIRVFLYFYYFIVIFPIRIVRSIISIEKNNSMLFKCNL